MSCMALAKNSFSESVDLENSVVASNSSMFSFQSTQQSSNALLIRFLCIIFCCCCVCTTSVDPVSLLLQWKWIEYVVYCTVPYRAVLCECIYLLSLSLSFSICVYDDAIQTRMCLYYFALKLVRMSSAAEPSNAKRTIHTNQRTNDGRATEREEENTQRIQLYFFFFCYWLLAHSESEENDRVRLDPIGNYIVSPRFIFSVYSSLSHSRFLSVQPKTIHKQLSASLVSVWFYFFF